MPIIIEKRSRKKRKVITEKSISPGYFFSKKFLQGVVVKFKSNPWKIEVQKKPDGAIAAFLSVKNTLKLHKNSPYKFRISVKKNQLNDALGVILPLVTSADSPFAYFKVSYFHRLAELKASYKGPDLDFSRLSDGGQVTLYVNYEENDAVIMAYFLKKLTQQLIDEGIEIGTIPTSDIEISDYVSARCGYSLTATGAAIKQYVPGHRDQTEPSKDTKHCYLFLLVKLYEIMRTALLPASEDDAGWNQANQNLIDFNKKYIGDKKTHHYDLIISFINEVIEPAERFLGKKIDYSEVTKLLKPKESMPGYNTFAADATTRTLHSLAAAGGGASSVVTTAQKYKSVALSGAVKSTVVDLHATTSSKWLAVATELDTANKIPEQSVPQIIDTSSEGTNDPPMSGCIMGCVLS